MHRINAAYCYPCSVFHILCVCLSVRIGHAGKLCDKYQLLLIDPRDGIILQTELDDYCDKLVDERRSSDA